MIKKTIAGVLTGLILWFILFFLVLFLIRRLWPNGDAIFQAIIDSSDYSLITFRMYCSFLLMFVVIGLLSGWVAALIAQQPGKAWFLAVPILVYAAINHLYLAWGILPDWYNIAVVVIVSPPIVVGSQLFRFRFADK